MMTDPIADMLTRIRNALAIRAEQVSMPRSKMKIGIAEVLKREGYILDFSTSPDPAPQGTLSVRLKYGPDGEDVIQHIQRFSRPGRRVYRGVDELPRVLNGLGITVVSTSQGIRSDRECRRERLGGEVLCMVY